ncbi:MAG: PAS domain S-box protein, partial [Anaerolineaceae bacterium]|nr:PAS domain S-box protein [Anaerolineaceae bacterium]
DVRATPESFELFKNELVAFFTGKTMFEADSRNIRLDGSEIVYRLKVSIAPGFEVSWEKVFVTIIDITKEKYAQQALAESEKRFRSVVEDQTELVHRFLPDGTITFANDAYCSFWGISRDEIIGSNIFQTIPTEYQGKIKDIIASLDITNPVAVNENPNINFRGAQRWNQWTYRAIFNANGEIIEYQAVARDITDRVSIENILQESEDQLRKFFEYASVGMIIADLNGRFQRVNPALCEMLGYSEVELLEKTFMEITHPDDLEADLSKTKQLLAGKINNLRMEGRYLHKKGHYVWVMLNTALIRDAEGEPLRYSGQVHDISERKKSEDELVHLATHDILTDLPNRGLFFDRLKHAISNAKRTQSMLAILFIDLDDFKRINDNYGHQAGDQVLKMVAERLNECARESDTTARMGGDEFTLLLENLPQPGDAVLVARKIVKTLARPFFVDGKHFSVAASLGISIYPQDGEDGEALLANADSAMYQAKESHETIVQFR